MANPWESDPVVTVRSRRDPRQDERERAETRYRNSTGDTNPLARPPILPGEEGYTTQGEYLPDAGVVVARQQPWSADPVATSSQIAAGAEAQRRVAGSEALSSGGQAIMQGLSLGWADELAGLIAGAGQGVSNAIRTAQGQPIEIGAGDLRNAVTNATREESERFSRERPVSNFALQALGGLLTGGGAIGTGVRGAVATGAAYGAGYGAGTGEGDTERLPGAVTGAVAGAATGGALAGAAQVAAPYAQRLAGIAGSINPGGAARSATRRLGPAAGAAVRMEPFITPQAIAERTRLQSLGVDASALDVIGGTGERMIRSAAGPAGPGAEMAVANSSARRANLKPEIMDVTRGLSPDQRSAEQVREGITTLRSNLASEQYAPAYATRVQVTPEILSAISDGPGRAALSRARTAAVARRDASQVMEIDALLNGETGEVSAGTLDRIRIAMSGRARDLSQRAGSRDIAGGLAERASDIDSTLATVPEIQPARQTYAELSGALENVDENLRSAAAVFSTNPQDFQRQIQGMTPTQQEALIIAVRERIMNTLGGQREAGTGALQTIAESPYSRQNLETLLGADEASRYISRIEEGVAQAQRAARVSPNTNSQTFGRMVDDETFNAASMVGAAADIGQSLTGNGFAIARTLDRLRSRATLSPEERAAIVELGIGSADNLERIVQVAQMARQAGRPVPREVRQFVDRSRNTLGAQSPVALQIERLLLPSRVAAEEDQE